jgi:polyphosphate kinase
MIAGTSFAERGACVPADGIEKLGNKDYLKKLLLKYWLEVGNDEQKRRFEARVDDPVRQWKPSPMDLFARSRWYDCSRARDEMLAATDTREAPWRLVRTDDRRRGRLNCIADILRRIPHGRPKRKKVKLPKRSEKHAYDDVGSLKGRTFVPNRH